MKLLTKINQAYFKYGFFLTLLVILLFVSVLYRFERVENKQELKNGANQIHKILTGNGTIADIAPFLSIDTVSRAVHIEGVFSDTIMFDPYELEMDEFLEYTFTVENNQVNYRVTFRDQKHDFGSFLLKVITAFSIVSLMMLLLMLLFINKINRNLFKVFRNNLSELKHYSLSSHKKLELQKTNIDEFDDLNEVLLKMSDRLGKDYQASKEFSENAAHELQTPLAIILNKCEALFSDPQLPDPTIDAIRDIYVSTDRLSGMIKALLLLAKIDHGQFDENELLSVKEIILERVDFFKEIVEDKRIKITIVEEQKCNLYVDKRLAILWIQNIIINAIKYTPEEKDIKILLRKDSLSISNYGENKIQHPEQIFNRFYKESEGIASTGIGLTLVKKIADHYQMEIKYTFKDFKHTFTFHFPEC